MEMQSKMFFPVFLLLIFMTVGTAYYRFIFAKNYIIEASADCDPAQEVCYVHACDPVAEEECTGNPKEDTSYYKVIRRMAKNIPLCDPNDESCDALTCPEGEADCEVIFCGENTMREDDQCNDPEAYKALLESDSAECEEGNEECVRDPALIEEFDVAPQDTATSSGESVDPDKPLE